MLHFRVLDTTYGFAAYVAGDHGVRRVYLPEASRLALLRRIARDEPGAVQDDRLLPAFARSLRAYFAGKRGVVFDVQVDLRGRGAFDRRVYHACARIEFGETVSYADLARAVGSPRAARAVGAAMKRNPCPIVIPCHRVLRSDGSVGGFSSPGGVNQKRALLELEA